MANCHVEKPNMYPSLLTIEPNARDPNKINEHLRLNFTNVIAEPDESAHSFEFLYSVAHTVYHYSKLFIYHMLTILVGLPLMLFWGLAFGAYTFIMIWVATPARRLAQSAIGEAGLYMQTICDAVIAPLYRSFGALFSNVRINLANQTTHSAQQIVV